MSIVTIFNTHLLEFIEDLYNVTDNKRDLIILKRNLKKVLLLNEKKIINLWSKYSKDFLKQIHEKDFNFFLKLDISKYKNINKYKPYLYEVCEKNKKFIMEYIFNLTKISNIYIAKKTS